jgi:hypothetical protein
MGFIFQSNAEIFTFEGEERNMVSNKADYVLNKAVV